MTDVLAPSPAEAEAGEPPARGTGSTGGRARRTLPAIDLALVQAALGLAVALASAAIVVFQLHPRLLLSPTTPAGGDMGAHVWGPAYLRDHLLPQGRLTGWTPDWYAGFPAYHFYMLVPSLAIIVLNAGLSAWAGLALTIGVVIVAWMALSAKPWRRRWLLVIAPALALALVSLPYGTAFKLVSVSGVVAFPVAAWLMGRLSRAPEPVPAVLAAATLPFLFDTNFSIYGGNIASTLAGEFAFSISLFLGLLAIGLVKRGLDTGRRRAGAAVLLALVALCHLIPLFFVVVACLLLVGLGRDLNRAWWVVLGLAAALAPVGLAPDAGSWTRALSPVPLIAVIALLLVTSGEVRSRTLWLITAGVPAVLLASFWMVPFVVREPFMNDMGWERLEAVGAALLTPPMRIALPLAAVGYALALAFRDRLGVLLGTLVLVSASATANVPDTRLWNARLLPFFYLSVYLLAGVAVGLLIRAAAIVESHSADRPRRAVMLAAPVVAFAAIVVAVAMPLRAPLPFAEVTPEGTYRWLAFENENASFIPSWASWNYSGYERKDAYREYHGIVSTMDQVGQDRGCGRAMWEYGPGLDRYGTPMALMLLPHWTDGCIGSMEGLFFESSQTTPFHFLNQSALSESPSRAQRDLPYVDFAGGASVDLGVRQLQTMGVRYYLALSDAAIAAARNHAELTEVAEAAPWVVFEVADAELVTPVTNLPVVVEGASIANPVHGDRFRAGWLGEAVSSFNDANPPVDALPAESGPEDWPRAAGLAGAPVVPAPPVAVSDISMGRDELSFRVDQVGVPVLVKVSYFPNWRASGAEGPWRAGPNLMVVVPTDNEVTLSYGNTWVEWLGWVLSATGVAAVVALWRTGRRRERATPHLDSSPERAPSPAAVPVVGGATAADLLDRDPDDGGLR